MPLTPPATSNESAIGAAEIEQLRSEFSGEIGVLVDIFNEESPATIAQMIAAIESGNADALRRAAHALKGCCVNFGARPIEALCQEMETISKAGDIQRAALLLEPIRAELKRVALALKDAALGNHNL